MAEVFLAHRLDAPHEPIVIKRILPHISEDRNFVQMFTDEARMAANLDHPNVVRVLDLGLIDGAYFIAMEYVHGEDIRRIYNRAYKLQRSLPLSHSIRVIADAASGLAHAHQLKDSLTGDPMGLVHRDVSPQNILVTYAGDAKVVDFGIAKAAHKVQQTRAGQLKGKYSYMSPEQALGDPIDHRTDIFALGVILYETTTGTRLFKRHNELATLQAVMKCEFVPPHEALANYPPELEDILLKTLARRPDDRWQSGDDLSAELYAFLHSSGLYVERDQVGAFMRDLFADEQSEAAEAPAAVPASEDTALARPRTDETEGREVTRPRDHGRTAGPTVPDGYPSAEPDSHSPTAEPDGAFSSNDEAGTDFPAAASDGTDERPTRGRASDDKRPTDAAEAGTDERPSMGRADKHEHPAAVETDERPTADRIPESRPIERPAAIRASTIDGRGRARSDVEDESIDRTIRGPAPDADEPKPGFTEPGANLILGEERTRNEGAPSSLDTVDGPTQAVDERRKETMLIRERARPAPESSWPDDAAPTVAAVPTYRPPEPQVEPTVEGGGRERGPTRPVAGQRSAGGDSGREVQPRPALSIRAYGGQTPDRTPPIRGRRGLESADEPRSTVDPGLGPTVRPPASWMGLSRSTIALVAIMTVSLAVFTAALVMRTAGDDFGQANLTVMTEPGAIIALGAQPIGTADAQGQAGPFLVPAGPQHVRVFHEGLGFERQRPLSLQAGQNYFFEIRGRTGWLRLAVAPWAQVAIDGKPMGLTPLPRIGLLEGVHRLRLENPDIGRFHEATVRIEAGREATVKVDLQSTGDQL